MLLLALMLALLAPITPDQPTTISLPGDYTPVDLTYTGEAGTVLTITARSEPLDVTLELLLDNQRLAFNDDTALSASDAVIDSFVLPADADYTIRVNSFSGAQTGQVEITLSARDPLPACELPSQRVRLSANRGFSCLFEARGSVTVTARDVSGTLDPVLNVVQNNEVVAANDDHDTGDSTLNTLDARLTFTAPNNLYVLSVTDFTGAAGTVELTIEIVP